MFDKKPLGMNASSTSLTSEETSSDNMLVSSTLQEASSSTPMQSQRQPVVDEETPWLSTTAEDNVFAPAPASVPEPELRFVEPGVKKEEFIMSMFTKYNRGGNVREMYDKTKGTLLSFSIGTIVAICLIVTICVCLVLIAFITFDIFQWARFWGYSIIIAVIIIFCKKTNLL